MVFVPQLHQCKHNIINAYHSFWYHRHHDMVSLILRRISGMCPRPTRRDVARDVLDRHPFFTSRIHNFRAWWPHFWCTFSMHPCVCSSLSLMWCWKDRILHLPFLLAWHLAYLWLLLQLQLVWVVNLAHLKYQRCLGFFAYHTNSSLKLLSSYPLWT